MDKTGAAKTSFLTGRRWREFLAYGVLLLFLLILFVVLNPDENQVLDLQYGGIVLTCVLLGAAAIGAILKRMTERQLIILILLAGLVIRLIYILNTPPTERQHDFLDAYGHLQYIQYIAAHGALPNTNQWQFYQPPLYYMVSAVFYDFSALILHFSMWRTVAGLSFLTVFYSMVSSVACYKILREIGLSTAAVCVGSAVFILHPTLILLSGSLNNDDLSLMFAMLCLLYVVRWYNRPNVKNIVMIAVTLGLGMCTKLSLVTLAPMIALVFLFKWRQKAVSGDKWGVPRQWIPFGAVVLPLGLWHSIRQMILFHQPFGFVPKLTLTNPQYTGSISLFTRFLTFSPAFLAGQALYCTIPGDTQIPEYILKSSLFGEFSFPSPYNPLAFLLLVANALIILLSLFSMIYVLARDREEPFSFWNKMMFFLYLVQIISYISFNVSYPFACTMDFRYLTITLVTGVYFIARGLHVWRAKGRKVKAASPKKARGARFARVMAPVSVAICVVFIIAAVEFYMLAV